MPSVPLIEPPLVHEVNDKQVNTCFTYSLVHIVATFMSYTATHLHGRIQGQDALLDAVLLVWAAAPQRATMAVDRLLALQLVTTARAVEWVFARSPGVRSVADHTAIELSFELLQCILDKAVARTLVRVAACQLKEPVLLVCVCGLYCVV